MTSRAPLAALLTGLLAFAARAGAPDARGTPCVTLFYTCDLRGHLAPWEAEEGRVGGAARLATVLGRGSAAHPRRIIVDVGNATIEGRKDAAAINRHALEALDTLGYEVVNCGDNEAAKPLEELSRLAERRRFHLISASLVRADTGQPVLRPHVVIRRGATRVAFIGLVGGGLPADRLGRGLRVLKPAEALDRSLAALGAEADVLVVLAYMGIERLYALAKAFPKVHVVLGGRVAATSAPCELEGRTVLAYLGDNGCTVGHLDARFPRRGWPAVSAGVTLLDESVAEAQALGPLVARFRAQIGAGRLPGADWDVRMPATSSHVGSDVCKLCHAKEHKRWLGTEHPAAYATLVKGLKHEEPRCLPCHVTGHRMPGGFGTEGAARPDMADPRRKKKFALAGVGCECCHGGGRRHLGVALKHRKDPRRVGQAPQLRTGPALWNCLRCHGAARPCLAPGADDPFDLGEYYKKVRCAGPPKTGQF